jgi:hypothetical protein
MCQNKCSESLPAHRVHGLSRVKFSPAGGNHQETAPLLQYRAPFRGDQRKLHFVAHDFRLECGGPGYLQSLPHWSGKDHASKFIHCDNGFHFEWLCHLPCQMAKQKSIASVAAAISKARLTEAPLSK